MTNPTTAAGRVPGRPALTDTAGWHRPDVETAALTYLTAVVGPVSARQLVDGLLARNCIEHTAAKDTREGASTLSSDALDLLAAIRDALDIPLPSLDEADERAQHRVMENRRSAVFSALATLLDYPEDPLHDGHAAYIRERIAETPVTYALWQDPDGGEQS